MFFVQEVYIREWKSKLVSKKAQKNFLHQKLGRYVKKLAGDIKCNERYASFVKNHVLRWSFSLTSVFFSQSRIKFHTKNTSQRFLTGFLTNNHNITMLIDFEIKL